MKLAIRVFAMFVVFAGLTAASVTSAPAPAIQRYFSATATGSGPLSLPLPPCPSCGTGLR